MNARSSVDIQAAMFHFLLFEVNPTPLINKEIQAEIIVNQAILSDPIDIKMKNVRKQNGNKDTVVNPL